MARTPVDDEDDANADQRSLEAEEAQAAQGSAGPDEVSSQFHSRDGDELERVRRERDSLYERLARATAEFQNMRKRQEQEAEQRCQYANSALIKSLLPVIDNFERALVVDATKVDAAAILKGMQIVHDQWMNVLKQQNVEEIAPAPGTPFDPNMHQALMQQDATYPVPTVVQLLQKGYSLHGRTLRPVQVAVSKSV